MKVNLLVAAILAASTGAASAASSVTLYGIVDVGYDKSHTTTDYKGDIYYYGPSLNGKTYLSAQNGVRVKSSTKVTQNDGERDDSRIGVKGEEDLGGGLSAVFNAEMHFDATQGSHNSPFFDQSYVGLKGRFGEVTIGRRATITDDLFGYNSEADDVDGDFVLPSDRYDNNLAYRGTFGGLTVGADLTTKENTGHSQFQVGAQYEFGNASVAASYAQETKHGHNYNLGAVYDFGKVQAYARIGHAKSSEDSDTEKSLGWAVGADFQLTPKDTIGITYSQGRTKGNFEDLPDNWAFNTPVYPSIYSIDTTTETKSVKRSRAISLEYIHDFSKRTNFYAGLTYQKSKDTTDRYTTATLSTLDAIPVVRTDEFHDSASIKSKSLSYHIGLQHKF